MRRLTWREALALRLYSVSMWAAQPLLRRKLKRRAVQESGYAHAVPERFGRYTAAPRQSPDDPPLLWIHAVSLGETRAAGILLRELRRHAPQLPVLLTHGTATGRAEGQRLLADIGIPTDQQAWLPWDMPAAVQRFLAHYRPTLGLLMETEVWPNLVYHARQTGIPLWLVNARLNEKSFHGAQKRLPSLLLPAYRNLANVLAQSEADAQRLRALGAPVTAITGNLKFDEKPSPALLAQGQRWRSLFASVHANANTDANPITTKPIIALASSREGEEALWLEALAQNPQARLAAQWLLIPRHPQRFDEVAALVQSAGLNLSRRSAWQTNAAPHCADIWLGDSMGEMPLYYALADLALMGASFAPLGGQNLIEACACGTPVIVGPHTFNFAQAAQDAITSGAAERAVDMPQAIARALRLTQDPAALQAARTNARQFAASQGGAASAIAQAVLATFPALNGS